MRLWATWRSIVLIFIGLIACFSIYIESLKESYQFIDLCKDDSYYLGIDSLTGDAIDREEWVCWLQKGKQFLIIPCQMPVDCNDEVYHHCKHKDCVEFLKKKYGRSPIEG